MLLVLNLGNDIGLQVLAQILKRHSEWSVVIFSAAGTINSAVEAMRLGALDFLQKPFTADALLGHTRRLLDTAAAAGTRERTGGAFSPLVPRGSKAQ